MKQEILNWLAAGQPYEEGVKLYTRFGHNATLLKNFSRKPTGQRKQMLAYKLVKLAGISEKYINNPSAIPKTQSEPAKKSSVKKVQKTSAETQWKGKIPFKEL